MAVQRNRRSFSFGALATLSFALIIPTAATVGGARPAENKRTSSDASSSSVTFEGHGWGHGVGLSQYGALGYAVNYGWSAAQILDHFYGGTVASTAPASDITVRLYALDGAATAVVHDKGQLVIDGYVSPTGQPATWRSLVANETTDGHYRVWGRTDANVCPGSGIDLNDPANGWTVVLADQATSVTFSPQIDTSASADPSDLVGLCEPSSGRVRYYRGSIRAINSNTHANRTVSQVPLEQYLRSVVGGEVTWAWAAQGGGRGMQALQAQAVAARSYGLAENKDTFAKTCDAVNCQTYRGAAYRTGVGGAFVAQEFGPTDAAVQATVGVVRRYGSAAGTVAYTMFASSSGGYTAQNSLGFTPVIDEGDAVGDNGAHSWTASVSTASIQAAWPGIGTYMGIAVTAQDGNGDWGGRVLAMTINGSAGSVHVTGNDFRAAMGLKSTWFHVVGGSPSPSPIPLPTPDPVPTSAPAFADACAGRATATVAGTGPNTSASRFNAVTPTRLIDTRSGIGTDAVRLGAGCTLTVDANVASDATAVVVNVTSVSPDSNGYLTAYPCGTDRPFTSIVPSVAGRIIPGTAVVPLNANGEFCVFSSTTTDLVVDLTGVYEIGAGERFEPIAPQRLLDSRGGAALRRGTVVRVQVGGSRGVPSSATGVAVTVHSTTASGQGFVTIWPCNDTRPTTSVLNVTAGSAVANHAQLGLDDSGGLCLFVSTAMRLVLDVSGWFGPAATTNFHAMTPQRVLDTRENLGLAGRFAAGQNRAVAVAGVGGIPTAGVAGVAGEVTAVGATRAGFITVHPCMTPAPNLSMVRALANLVAATTVTGALDGSGRWCLKPNAAMDIVIDVSGWYGVGA